MTVGRDTIASKGGSDTKTCWHLGGRPDDGRRAVEWSAWLLSKAIYPHRTGKSRRAGQPGLCAQRPGPGGGRGGHVVSVSPRLCLGKRPYDRT